MISDITVKRGMVIACRMFLSESLVDFASMAEIDGKTNQPAFLNIQDYPTISYHDRVDRLHRRL